MNLSERNLWTPAPVDKNKATIAHAVGFLSRKSSSPSKSNWIDVKKAMRYIPGTLSFGLFYKRADKFVSDFYGFSDAD